jgi:hypothetical protein
MSSLALRDDFNPDHPVQMLLHQAADVIASLHEAGVLESTGTSLTLTDPNLSYERYEALGVAIGLMNRSCQWWVGDWLNFGEGVYGERFAQAAAATGLSEQVLLRRMYVAKQIPPSRRRASLPFSVHVEVAGLSAREQTAWLNKAERENWTRAELREHMRAARTEQSPELPVDPTGVDMDQLVAAARQLDAEKRDAGADYLVTKETMARLHGALGGEGEE